MTDDKKAFAAFSDLWEYRVRPGCESEFEQRYGPDGDWVRLFRRGSGHVGTTLHRDLTDRRRYVTVDGWTSKDARDAFHREWGREYRSLDEQCASLTEEERLIGSFVNPAHRAVGETGR